MGNFLEKYNKDVKPLMKNKFNYSNVNMIPKFIKVVINTGIGRYLKDEKMIQQIEEDLRMIVGQKPDHRSARKSIAGFKIRKGMNVGFKATLRRNRMFDFLERLIKIALPRSRDFKGLSLKSVDKNGNFNIGIKEQIIFPETSNSKLIFGFEISVITNSKSREEAIELYRLMGFPIKELKP